MIERPQKRPKLWAAPMGIVADKTQLLIRGVCMLLSGLLRGFEWTGFTDHRHELRISNHDALFFPKRQLK
jgi:hypothetical protein